MGWTGGTLRHSVSPLPTCVPQRHACPTTPVDPGSCNLTAASADAIMLVSGTEYLELSHPASAAIVTVNVNRLQRGQLAVSSSFSPHNSSCRHCFAAVRRAIDKDIYSLVGAVSFGLLRVPLPASFSSLLLTEYLVLRLAASSRLQVRSYPCSSRKKRPQKLLLQLMSPFRPI